MEEQWLSRSKSVSSAPKSLNSNPTSQVSPTAAPPAVLPKQTSPSPSVTSTPSAKPTAEPTPPAAPPSATSSTAKTDNVSARGREVLHFGGIYGSGVPMVLTTKARTLK